MYVLIIVSLSSRPGFDSMHRLKIRIRIEEGKVSTTLNGTSAHIGSRGPAAQHLIQRAQPQQQLLLEPHRLHFLLWRIAHLRSAVSHLVVV